MGLGKKIKNYFSRSREKHKLVFIDDSTYHEKWRLRVSSFNLMSLFALYTIILLIGAFFIIKYTPLKSFFVEKTNYNSRKEIEKNTELIDRLMKETTSKQHYLDNLKIILKGEDFSDSINTNLSVSLGDYTPDFTKNTADSLLRYKIEHKNSSTLTRPNNESFSFYFAPVNGTVSRSIELNNGHFGVDIVTLKNDPVKACLEGVIVFSGWVQAEGNVVIIQHEDNLISIYKHCSAILKEKGDNVQTGDPIAIVGNSGENTTGVHLHFELWKNGLLLNPEDYISF